MTRWQPASLFFAVLRQSLGNTALCYGYASNKKDCFHNANWSITHNNSNYSCRFWWCWYSRKACLKAIRQKLFFWQVHLRALRQSLGNTALVKVKQDCPWLSCCGCCIHLPKSCQDSWEQRLDDLAITEYLWKLRLVLNLAGLSLGFTEDKTLRKSHWNRFSVMTTPWCRGVGHCPDTL